MGDGVCLLQFVFVPPDISSAALRPDNEIVVVGHDRGDRLRRSGRLLLLLLPWLWCGLELGGSGGTGANLGSLSNGGRGAAGFEARRWLGRAN